MDEAKADASVTDMNKTKVGVPPEVDMSVSSPVPMPTDNLSETAVHPKATEILRQVEYYFNEENLRHDAHLLGLIKEGDGLVSLKEILSWKKMRKYKPMTAVRNVIRESEVVEVVDDKFLRRRVPLEGPVYVVPEVNHPSKKIVVPEDKPWLTKNMMKPTGFENHHADGPIRPEEYEKNRQDFDPEHSFTYRIELAIMKFCSKRKWHARHRAIWEKFLRLGGFDSGQKQFTGSLEDKSMEAYTRKELAELTCHYGVCDAVMDGLYDGGPDKEHTWIVDFEALAKGFLSSKFVYSFNWHNEENVQTATSVLRSFYNYLLLRDVCPEYNDQILAARAVCDLADIEFPKLKEVDLGLPGDFNVACSVLHGGHFSTLYCTGDWCKEEDRMGFSDADARIIFAAGLTFHGNADHLQQLEAAKLGEQDLAVISRRNMGLEVVKVMPSEGKASITHIESSNTNRVIKPTGKLVCKFWEVPHRPPPEDTLSDCEQPDESQTYEIILEDAILQSCYPGLKIEADVSELSIGICWIDRVDAVYPSFFRWLQNEDEECTQSAKEKAEAKLYDRWWNGGDTNRWIRETEDGEDAQVPSEELQSVQLEELPKA